VALCAKQHQHVCRQRRHFHHTTALDLMRAYDTIYVEAIQPSNLGRRPAPKQDEDGTYVHNGASQKVGLNTSLHDAGWRHFRSILAYKAACAGKRVDVVNPAYTTQDCSGVLPDGSRCLQRVVKSLSVRTRRTHVSRLSVLWAGAGPR
jgi:putative transposase